MKKAIGMGAVVAAMAFVTALSSPVFAQSRQAENEFQRYLSKHPGLASDPALLNDPHYLNQHPNLKTFLQTHPGVRAQAESMGAYDQGHVWRDQNWWHQNNPNWIAQNRPQWIQENPGWRDDGDWDESHEWHDRDWWREHRADWARDHHPEWAKFEGKVHEHEEKAEAHWEKHHHGDAPNGNPGNYNNPGHEHHDNH